MQADVGDGMDISCSSAVVSEHVELSVKDSIGNSETDVTKEKDDVAQEENAPKD